MKYNNHNLSEKQTNKFMLKSIGVFFDIYNQIFMFVDVAFWFVLKRN